MTFAPHWSAAVGTSMFAGQESVQVGSVSSNVLMALAPLPSGLTTPTRQGPRMSVVLPTLEHENGISAFDDGKVNKKSDGSPVTETGV